MLEGEKNGGGAVVKGGQNLPLLDGIGLTDLQGGPPAPLLCSGITALLCKWENVLKSLLDNVL